MVALASIGGLSALMATSEPIGMTPFFYLWPVVFVAYFDRRRVLGLTLAWMSTTLVIGVLANAQMDLKVDVVIGTVASVTAVALLVTTMRERDRQLQMRLSLAARTDPLTGLLNRRAFDAGLRELLARFEPVIILFDIDHFKQINDVHGHETGDRVLIHIAEALRAEAPADTLICRHGGEEIVVALASGGIAGGHRLAPARSRARRSWA